MSHKNSKSASKPADQTDIWTSDNSDVFRTAAEKVFCQDAMSWTVTFLILVIYSLQTLATLLETTFITFPDSLETLRTSTLSACKIVIGRTIFEINEEITTFQIVIIACIVAYLVGCLGFTVLYFGKFTRILRNYARAFRYWRSLIQVHFYCLFLPINNLLIELLVNARHLSTSEFSGFIAIIVIAESINTILCIIFFFTNSNLKSNDFLSLQNDSFLKYSCMERILMSLINLLIFNDALQMSSMAINIMNLLLACCHILLFLYTLPFYHKFALKFFVLQTGILLSFPVVNIINDLVKKRNQEDAAQQVFFIIMLILPFYFKFMFSWIESKISQTLLTALNILSLGKATETVNKFWLVQSIYHLKYVLEMDFGAPLKSRLNHEGYMKHIKDYLRSNNIGMNTASTLDSQLEAPILIISLLKLWRNKYHITGIIMADLMVTECNMIPESYAFLQETLQSNISFNMRLSSLIVCSKIQHIIDNNKQENNTKLTLSTFFGTYISWFKLKERMIKQMEESDEFYKTVLDETPDLISLIKFGKKAHDYSKEIDRFWDKIPEAIRYSYGSMMLVFALYKIKVDFEYKEAAELFKRYCNLMRRKDATKYISEINDETALSTENAVFLINAMNKDFGHIVYSSNSALEMFGEKPSNLFGKNINILMPPLIRSVHNTLVTKKLESTESVLNTTNLQSFAKDKQGFIFPVNILASVFTSISRGFYFVGIVRKVKNKAGYILMDENGYLDSYSREIQQKLNLPPPSLGQKVHILELCGRSESKNPSDFREYLNTILTSEHTTGHTKNFTIINSLKKNSEIIKTRTQRGQPGIQSLSTNSEKYTQRRTIKRFSAMIEDIPTKGVSSFHVRPGNLTRNKIVRARKRYGKAVTLSWNVETKEYADRVLRVLALEDTTAEKVGSGADNTKMSTRELGSKSTATMASKEIKANQFGLRDRSDSNNDHLESEDSENLNGYSEEIEEDMLNEMEPASRSKILPSFERAISVENRGKSSIYETQRVSVLSQKLNVETSSYNQDSMQLLGGRQDHDSRSYKKPGLDARNNQVDLSLTLQIQATNTGRKVNVPESEIEPEENSLASPKPLLQPIRNCALKSQEGFIVSETDMKNDQFTDEGHQAMIDKFAKSYVNRVKHFEVRNNLRTLKYYRFAIAKVPIIWLIGSLIVLLFSSIYVFNISKDAIPIVEDTFPVLQSSLDRLIYFAEIDWYLMAFAYIVNYSSIYGMYLMMYQGLIAEANNELATASANITRNVNIFSSGLQDFIFSRNITLYTDDFLNHSSKTNYVILNSIEAANMMADNAVGVTNNQNYGSVAMMGHLNFLLQNMFNDILTSFQELPNLIVDEINSNINSTQDNSSFVFTLTPVCFATTILVLFGIYTKSYLDTRKFLELFTYFKDKNIEEIQFQMNMFRESLDSSLKDQELLKQFQYKMDATDKDIKAHKTKVIKGKGLYLTIYKRAFLMFFLLIIPIIVSVMSQNTFNSNFSTIIPTLDNLIKPKQIITQAIITLVQVGTYAGNLTTTMHDRPISDVVAENIAELGQLVLEESLSSASTDYYALFHQDYCQFVMPQNYSTCLSLLNGVSSAGITGMILTLQDFLRTYTQSVATSYTSQVAQLEISDFFTVLLMANEAVDNAENQSFTQLKNHLENIKTAILIFIAIGIALCIILSSLGIIYVYLASIRERRGICSLLLLFPANVIAMNLRIKAFLRKNSPEFQKVFQKQQE